MISNQSIIEMKNVLKKYKLSGNSDITVLDNINLSISDGEVVLIMGPSGSGKSTLLNILTGLEDPTTGVVKFKDHLISSLSDDKRTDLRKKEIGILFQFFELHEGLTVLETLELTALIGDNYDNNTIEKILDLINRLSLSEKKDSIVDKLSRGEKQRVAIARALINNPTLIVADEPTGALDPDTAKYTIKLIRKVAKDFKKTLIICTHDFNIPHHTDRLIILENGKIKLDKRGIKSIEIIKSFFN
jgi:putative ABC transport system ATP-binding protein